MLSLALTVACAKFTHQHPSALNSIFHSTVCSNRSRSVERSFRAMDLATQLLLRLNPKREAAASIHRAPSPNRACGPALEGSVHRR